MDKELKYNKIVTDKTSAKDLGKKAITQQNSTAIFA